MVSIVLLPGKEEHKAASDDGLDEENADESANENDEENADELTEVCALCHCGDYLVVYVQ
jgi:hypothetical protein